MERCGKCPNCVKLELEKRLALMDCQPYSLVRGRLMVNPNPPAFDNEAWNKRLAELPCVNRIPYIKVNQTKVGDVLRDYGRISWKEWEGSDKALTITKKGGVTVPFHLVDEQGKLYLANGQRLTSYSHTIVFRDGECVGRFFCKYW